MAAELQIRLFGPLTIICAGQPIPESAWHSRQERRLLGILLTARGSPVPVARLIEWLWPGANVESTATTLRATVSNLRRMLEPDSDRASSHYIQTRQGGYLWNPDARAWIDVDAFLALVQPSGDTQSLHSEQLEQALALYRGEYLAHEPEAPWALAMRERLRSQYLQAVEALAEHFIIAGQDVRAVQLAQNGLEHDILYEPLYRTLMRAQARLGDIAAALQSYERYRQTLDNELGALPSAQTQQVHADILRGIVPAGSGSVARPSLLQGAAQVHTAHRSETPFVGREQELAELRAWVSALRQRQGGIVTIVGEAGIGKTRLVNEALYTGSIQGTQLIVVRCTAIERTLPFAALSEALRPLVRNAPDSLLRRLPRVALAQVSELLPMLRERMPSLPVLPVLPPAESRTQLIDGLVDLALALAHSTPLVIVCDDAQWADQALLLALERLARHAPRHALLIILAYRSEELAEHPQLHALLRALGRDMLLRPVVLGRLDDQAITELLALLAHVSPEHIRPLAQRLAVRSGGNPLFLSVLIQSLIEAHSAPSFAALTENLAFDTPLPDPSASIRLRDLVVARIERLPEQARILLEQLAIIGRPVSLDLIEQLGGAQALDTAQLLLDRHFLIDTPTAMLGFSHDLVRSIIVATLGSPRRRQLHRQAASAIAALHGTRPERANELVFHLSHSGRGNEAELLYYAIIAGDNARRAFGYHEALRYYDMALLAGEQLGSAASATDMRQAFAGWMRVCEALLDWPGLHEAIARHTRWAARYPGEPALAAPRRLILLRALAGDLAGAAAISAEQALRQPEAIAAIQDMLHRTAQILQPAVPSPVRPAYTHPFLHPAPLPGEPAVDLPALLGPDEAAPALFQAGWAALMQGLLSDAEPCLMQAYSLALETGQLSAAVIAALQLAHLYALRGIREQTTDWMNTSLELAERSPEAAWAAVWPRIHQAFLLLLDHRYAEAQARFTDLAVQLHNLPAFQSHRASVEVGLGCVALAAGELDRASEHLAAGLASPQLLYGFVYTTAQHGMARLAALHNDIDTARAVLDHTLAYSAQRSLLPEYVRSAIEILRVERDYGEPPLPLALLEHAAVLAEQAGLAPSAEAARAVLAKLITTNEHEDHE